MIHVARQPEPAVLGKKIPKYEDKTEREAVEAAFVEHIKTLPAKEFRFDFEVYKKDEVKKTLDASFAGKCAYCETFYSASQPMDVEHWRPKGEVHLEDEVLKPGYYWLASDWENLFPSCIDCNRARKQVDVIERKRILLGKANQFPLSDEATRILEHRRTEEIKNERVLLVDPCNDDPERFFAYTEEGAIIPRQGLQPGDRQRALASIQVYALNRSALVAERLEVIRRVDHRLGLMGTLAQLRDELEGLAQPKLAEIVAELIRAESVALEEMMAGSRPFAGLARHFIREAQRP